MAGIHQVMGETEAGRAKAHHQDLVAGGGKRQRTSHIQGVPACQQAVDFEAPGQGEHILEHPRFDLGNVDRVLLLVDASLHAVVADAMAGGGQHWVIDAGDCEGGNDEALVLRLMHLRDLLLQRAAGDGDAERVLGEGASLFVLQALGAGIAALVVAEDAVAALAQGACEIGALIGQCEAVAGERVVSSGYCSRCAGEIDRRLRDKRLVLNLAGGPEQHVVRVEPAAGGAQHRPGGVAAGEIEICLVSCLVLHPGEDGYGEAKRVERLLAKPLGKRAGKCFAVKARGFLGRERLGRAPLYEQPPAGIERRQPVVAVGRRLQLWLNPEQPGDEGVEVRCQGQQQFGLSRSGQRIRRRACRRQ